MDIEKITTGALTKADLGKTRAIPDGEGGHILAEEGVAPRLFQFELNEKRYSAVLLVSEHKDEVEFICAGKTGEWMRAATQEFLLERQIQDESGLSAQAKRSCSTEIFERAAQADYGLIASPSGLLDLVKRGEDHALTLTNDVWTGEEGATPSAGDKAWICSRIETKGRDEVGYIQLWEPLTLESALQTNEHLAALNVVHPEEVDFHYDSLEEMRADLLLGAVTEVVEDDFAFEGEVVDFLGPDFVVDDSDLVNDDVMSMDEAPMLEEDLENDAEVLREAVPLQGSFGF